MANGPYGQLAPVAGVLTKLTTSAAAAGKKRSVLIGVCSTLKDGTAAIDIAVSTATLAENVPLVAPYKSSGRALDPGGEYERSVLLFEGEHIWVRTDKAGVSFDVRGVEDNV